MPKKLIRAALGRMGYALVPLPRAESPQGAASSPEQDYYRVVNELRHCEAMRDIHRHDAVEIEELYRKFVFPDLPRHAERAKLLNDLIGTTIGEAIYIVRSLHEGMKVEGDICEFGVAQGATSRLIGSEIMAGERRLWLFDSFEGLPAPGPEDKLIHDIFNLGSMAAYKGTMASPESEVLGKLDAIGFPRARAKIKKGWVKDSIRTGELPAQVAFAYVDFDFYEPIKDALEFLDGRMPVGGRIVVDDYGYFSEGAQLAVDQFIARMAGSYTFEMPLPFAGHFCVLAKTA